MSSMAPPSESVPRRVGVPARVVVLATIASLSLKELLRRHDAYVALILAVAIMVPLGGVNLFGVEGVVRHLREIALVLVWLFSIAIAITTAARQLPAELEIRTVYPLLARPVRRSDVVLGKAFGAFSASKLCLLLFYGLFVALSVWKQADWGGLALFQAFGLHAVFLAMVTAMVVAGSTVLTRSANVTLSVLVVAGMLLFGHRLAALGAGEGASALAARFLNRVAPHFELFDMRARVIHEWGILPWGAWLQICLYGLVYAGAFLALACLLFRRKPL